MVTGINASAASDGTSSHKEDKKAGKNFGVIAAAIIALAGAIAFGNWIFSDDESEVAAIEGADESANGKFVLAPTDKPACIRVPKHLTIDWWGEDPTGDRFTTTYYDENGVERHYRNGAPSMRSVCFQSTSSAPEKVSYEFKRK